MLGPPSLDGQDLAVCKVGFLPEHLAIFTGSPFTNDSQWFQQESDTICLVKSWSP